MNSVLSVDIEVNGPVPGFHSMISLGSVAFNMKGKLLGKFSVNIEPIPGLGIDKGTMEWWAKQPKEIWERVTKNPRPAKEAIQRFANWMANFDNPRMMMAPVLFDGTFIRYYTERYLGESQMFMNAIDLRSVIFAFTGFYDGDYKELIRFLTGVDLTKDLTHIAVEDAMLQGRALFGVLKWAEEKKLRIKL